MGQRMYRRKLERMSDKYVIYYLQIRACVWTAGSQRSDRMPEDMPDRIIDRMPEDRPDKMPWDMPDRYVR